MRNVRFFFLCEISSILQLYNYINKSEIISKQKKKISIA